MLVETQMNTKMAQLLFPLIILFWAVTAKSTIEQPIHGVRTGRQIRGHSLHRRQIRPNIRLYRFLKKRFIMAGEPLMRPTGSNSVSEPTPVTLALSLREVTSFKAVTGVIEAVVTLSMMWSDPNLKWNPNQFGGLRSMNLPPKRLWIPDIKLYNGRHAKLDWDTDTLVNVQHQGYITFKIPAKLESTCTATGSPAKIWKCDWKFGSWMYNENEISLEAPAIEHEMVVDSSVAFTIKAASCKKKVVCEHRCKVPHHEVVFTVEVKSKQHNIISA